jgi:hypothetical protein
MASTHRRVCSLDEDDRPGGEVEEGRTYTESDFNTRSSSTSAS